MATELKIIKANIYRGRDVVFTDKGWKVLNTGIAAEKTKVGSMITGDMLDSAQDSEEACYKYVDRQKKIEAGGSL